VLSSSYLPILNPAKCWGVSETQLRAEVVMKYWLVCMTYFRVADK
jgi:hypothetical protein